MKKRVIGLMILGVFVSGCGGTSVTLSGSGEVAAIIQKVAWKVDAPLIKKAVDMMEAACQSRKWELFLKPVPMSKPSGTTEPSLVLSGAAKKDAEVIAETVERVFRWFPSRSVALSGCCVSEEDKDNAKKACPTPKKKHASPTYKIPRPTPVPS